MKVRLEAIYDDGSTWLGETDTEVQHLIAGLGSLEPNCMLYRTLDMNTWGIIKEWVRGKKGWVEVEHVRPRGTQ